MSAAERAYFDGDHCQHVAARDENRRLRRIAQRHRTAILRGMAHHDREPRL